MNNKYFSRIFLHIFLYNKYIYFNSQDKLSNKWHVRSFFFSDLLVLGIFFVIMKIGEVKLYIFISIERN